MLHDKADNKSHIPSESAAFSFVPDHSKRGTIAYTNIAVISN